MRQKNPSSYLYVIFITCFHYSFYQFHVIRTCFFFFQIRTCFFSKKFRTILYLHLKYYQNHFLFIFKFSTCVQCANIFFIKSYSKSCLSYTSGVILELNLVFGKYSTLVKRRNNYLHSFHFIISSSFSSKLKLFMKITLHFKVFFIKIRATFSLLHKYTIVGARLFYQSLMSLILLYLYIFYLLSIYFIRRVNITKKLMRFSGTYY